MNNMWKVLRVIEEFRKIDPEMPLQMAACFTLVTVREGITMKDLGRILGMSQSSASRNVAALSKVHRLNKPGYDLLEAQEDPTERRRRVIYLTAKGRRVADSIMHLMAEPESEES